MRVQDHTVRETIGRRRSTPARTLLTPVAAIRKYRTALFLPLTFFAILLVLLSLSGCLETEAARREKEPTAQDQKESEAAVWRVSDSPVLRIGVATGDANQELYRITGARFNGDGEVVVANEGSCELRFYDFDGELLRAVGARGEGPGEYQRMSLLPDFSSDSIIVYDPGLLRLSVLASDGTFVRSFLIPAPAGHGMAIWGRILGRLGTGDFILRSPSTLAPDLVGAYRPATALEVLTPAGQAIAEIGSFLGDEVLFNKYRGSPVFSRLPFLQRLVVAVGSTRVFLSEGPDLEIRALAEAGLLTGVFQGDLPKDTISLETYRTWYEAQLRAVENEDARAETRKYYEAIYQPWPTPPVMEAFVDQDGDLWVAEFRETNGIRVWRILTSGLTERARLELPAEWGIMDARKDQVLLLRRADPGFEVVEVRDIEGVGGWP